MSSPRVSLRDVARQLGVSTMTVSRALRGRPGVSADLSAEIRAAAEKLGYRPDPALHRLVQHLRTRRQNGVRAVIAAVTDIPQNLEPPYFTLLRRHVAARAQELGFSCSLLRVGAETDAWSALPRIWRARGVEGVVLLPMIEPIALSHLGWDGVSVVTATSSVTAPAFHRVAPHHALNARLLIDRLSAAGHRRIGFVGTTTHSQRTLEAFPAALAWHHLGLGLRCAPLLHEPARTPSISEWFRRERPTAVIVGRESDLPAYQAELAAAAPTLAWALAGIGRRPAPVCGIDERHDLIAAAAVDALAGMIVRGERGAPTPPGMTLLPGDWFGAPGTP